MTKNNEADPNREAPQPTAAVAPSTKTPLWQRPLIAINARSPVVIVLLSLIALIMTLYFIRAASLILVPITFAWLLSTLLSPAVTFAQRFKVPPVLSAGIVVGLAVAGLVVLILFITEPAAQWVRELPGVLQELRGKLASLEGPLSDLQAVTKEVDELAKLDDAEEAIEVQIEEANFLQGFLTGYLPLLMTYGAISIFLTYFLLASGNQMLRRLTMLGTSWGVRRRIVRTVHRIRGDVARYLATITMINFGLGLIVTLAMHALDVPNPLLWGFLAGLLNFAPYIGPALTIIVLTLVGISSFESLAEGLMVPTVFFLITVLEGQLVTPMIVGRRLALSPATVFIAVVVWGWLWGVAGALMAVPIFASLKIIFENIPALEGVARIIERK